MTADSDPILNQLDKLVEALERQNRKDRAMLPAEPHTQGYIPPDLPAPSVVPSPDGVIITGVSNRTNTVRSILWSAKEADNSKPLKSHSGWEGWVIPALGDYYDTYLTLAEIVRQPNYESNTNATFQATKQIVSPSVVRGTSTCIGSIEPKTLTPGTYAKTYEIVDYEGFPNESRVQCFAPKKGEPSLYGLPPDLMTEQQFQKLQQALQSVFNTKLDIEPWGIPIDRLGGITLGYQSPGLFNRAKLTMRINNYPVAFGRPIRFIERDPTPEELQR